VAPPQYTRSVTHPAGVDATTWIDSDPAGTVSPSSNAIQFVTGVNHRSRAANITASLSSASGAVAFEGQDVGETFVQIPPRGTIAAVPSEVALSSKVTYKRNVVIDVRWTMSPASGGIKTLLPSTSLTVAVTP
jgi:hypothetical protein